MVADDTDGKDILPDGRRGPGRPPRLKKGDLAPQHIRPHKRDIGHLEADSGLFNAVKQRAIARGIDLDAILADQALDRLVNQKISPGQERAWNAMMNLRGSVTGKYPHISPQQSKVEVEHTISRKLVLENPDTGESVEIPFSDILRLRDEGVTDVEEAGPDE